MRAQRRRGAERHGVGDHHRRDQPESGLRHVLHFPRAAGRGVRGQPSAGLLVDAVLLVANAAEHGELHRAAEALAGVRAVDRMALLVAQVVRDAREAHDRVDGSHGRRALAATRERLELRIDL